MDNINTDAFTVNSVHTCYIGTADQNWFSGVVFNLGLPVHTGLPCLYIFPLCSFQKWDCLPILAHAFAIVLLLLMDVLPGEISQNIYRLSRVDTETIDCSLLIFYLK